MVDPPAATRRNANLFSAVGPAPSGTLKINSSHAANRALGPPLFDANFRARFLNGFFMVSGSHLGGNWDDFPLLLHHFFELAFCMDF